MIKNNIKQVKNFKNIDVKVYTTYDEDWNATDNEQTPKTPVL